MLHSNRHYGMHEFRDSVFIEKKRVCQAVMPSRQNQPHRKMANESVSTITIRLETSKRPFPSLAFFPLGPLFLCGFLLLSRNDWQSQIVAQGNNREFLNS
jgi:hypothetical protein